jgi:hypothetical protein
LANLKFTSRVDIFCHDCRNLCVALSMSWDEVAPGIALSQESLDFGHVVGHSVSRSVQVKNNATFALEYVYNVHPAPSIHTANMSGADAFVITRSRQWPKPGDTGDATVVFAPDHDDLAFQAILVIAAGEQGESREVPMTVAE